MVLLQQRSCPRRLGERGGGGCYRQRSSLPVQLRIAFDGDAVIFGDEGERMSREQGVEAFGRYERERAREPLTGGPFRNFYLRSKHYRLHSHPVKLHRSVRH